MGFRDFGYVALAIGMVALLGLSVRWNAEREKMNAKLVVICKAHGLEAVDLDYPHTPKCLNVETGIMTVPKDLFDARGGRL